VGGGGGGHCKGGKGEAWGMGDGEGGERWGVFGYEVREGWRGRGVGMGGLGGERGRNGVESEGDFGEEEQWGGRGGVGIGGCPGEGMEGKV